MYRRKKSAIKKTVPPFVQVDFLQAGTIFVSTTLRQYSLSKLLHTILLYMYIVHTRNNQILHKLTSRY